MFTTDGYFYKGRAFDTLAHAAELARGIPSLQKWWLFLIPVNVPKSRISRMQFIGMIFSRRRKIPRLN